MDPAYHRTLRKEWGRHRQGSLRLQGQHLLPHIPGEESEFSRKCWIRQPSALPIPLWEGKVMKLGFGYFFCFMPIKILVFYFLNERGSPWPSMILSSEAFYPRGDQDPGLNFFSLQVEWLRRKGLGKINYLRREIFPKRLDLALEEKVGIKWRECSPEEWEVICYWGRGLGLRIFLFSSFLPLPQHHPPLLNNTPFSLIIPSNSEMAPRELRKEMWAKRSGKNINDQ